MGERIRFVVLVLTIAACAVAQTKSGANPPKSPKQVVEEYCKLDADGALTSSEGWATISPLFVWPDAPGWDTFTVIRGYKVGEAKVTGKLATVPVTYDVAGTLDSTPRFVSAKVKKVTVIYHLRYSNKQWVKDADGNPDHEEPSGPAVWKITKPQLQPHVSHEKALAMAQNWVANPPDPAAKPNAEAALKALQGAK